MNLTIDSNVQNIIFNGNDVQKLIFNGAEVWSKIVDTYINYGDKYTTFEFTTSGTWGMKRNNSSAGSRTLYYRKNGGSWSSISITSTSGNTISVVAGDIIETYMMYGSSSTSINYSSYYTYFTGTAEYKVYGNIYSLYNGQDFINSCSVNLPNYAFQYIFYQSNVIDASNLILCFNNYGNYSISSLFGSCTKLKTGPVIIGNINTGEKSCYYCLGGCTSLVDSGPCIFNSITGYNVLSNFFYGCTKLNKITALINSFSGTWSYYNYNVPKTGTFIKVNGVSWNTGNSGIPTGWTVVEQDMPTAFYLPYGASEVSNIVGSDTLTGTIYLSRNGTTWYGKKLSQASYQDAATFMSGAAAPYNQMFTNKGYTVGSGRLLITDFNISETGNNLYVKVDNGGAPFMLCFMGNNGYSGKRVASYAYGGKITSLCSPYWYVMDKFDPDTVFVFGKMFVSTADDSYTLVIDKNTTI